MLQTSTETTVAMLRGALEAAGEGRGRIAWENYEFQAYRDRHEPILHRGESWQVTLSASSCLVLNSETLVIIDVDDLSEARQPVDRKHATFNSEGELVGRFLELLQEQDAGLQSSSWRLYATAKGWRLIRTDAAASEGSLFGYCALMHELPADPRYAELCESQRCYRARMTPKPWRCNDRTLGVCSIIRDLGSGDVCPELVEQLELHDEMTYATEYFATDKLA
jgi:hypothetical protein